MKMKKFFIRLAIIVGMIAAVYLIENNGPEMDHPLIKESVNK